MDGPNKTGNNFCSTSSDVQSGYSKKHSDETVNKLSKHKSRKVAYPSSRGVLDAIRFEGALANLNERLGSLNSMISGSPFLYERDIKPVLSMANKAAYDKIISSSDEFYLELYPSGFDPKQLKPVSLSPGSDFIERIKSTAYNVYKKYGVEPGKAIADLKSGLVRLLQFGYKNKFRKVKDYEDITQHRLVSFYLKEVLGAIYLSIENTRKDNGEAVKEELLFEVDALCKAYGVSFDHKQLKDELIKSLDMTYKVSTPIVNIENYENELNLSVFFEKLSTCTEKGLTAISLFRHGLITILEEYEFGCIKLDDRNKKLIEFFRKSGSVFNSIAGSLYMLPSGIMNYSSFRYSSLIAKIITKILKGYGFKESEIQGYKNTFDNGLDQPDDYREVEKFNLPYQFMTYDIHKRFDPQWFDAKDLVYKHDLQAWMSDLIHINRTGNMEKLNVVLSSAFNQIISFERERGRDDIENSSYLKNFFSCIGFMLKDQNVYSSNTVEVINYIDSLQEIIIGRYGLSEIDARSIMTDLARQYVKSEGGGELLLSSENRKHIDAIVNDLERYLEKSNDHLFDLNWLSILDKNDVEKTDNTILHSIEFNESKKQDKLQMQAALDKWGRHLKALFKSDPAEASNHLQQTVDRVYTYLERDLVQKAMSKGAYFDESVTAQHVVEDSRWESLASLIKRKFSHLTQIELYRPTPSAAQNAVELQMVGGALALFEGLSETIDLMKAKKVPGQDLIGLYQVAAIEALMDRTVKDLRLAEIDYWGYKNSDWHMEAGVKRPQQFTKDYATSPHFEVFGKAEWADKKSYELAHGKIDIGAKAGVKLGAANDKPRKEMKVEAKLYASQYIKAETKNNHIKAGVELKEWAGAEAKLAYSYLPVLPTVHLKPESNLCAKLKVKAGAGIDLIGSLSIHKSPWTNNYLVTFEPKLSLGVGFNIEASANVGVFPHGAHQVGNTFGAAYTPFQPGSTIPLLPMPIYISLKPYVMFDEDRLKMYVNELFASILLRMGKEESAANKKAKYGKEYVLNTRLDRVQEKISVNMVRLKKELVELNRLSSAGHLRRQEVEFFSIHDQFEQNYKEVLNLLQVDNSVVVESQLQLIYQKNRLLSDVLTDTLGSISEGQNIRTGIYQALQQGTKEEGVAILSNLQISVEHREKLVELFLDLNEARAELNTLLGDSSAQEEIKDRLMLISLTDYDNKLPAKGSLVEQKQKLTKVLQQGMSRTPDGIQQELAENARNKT